MEQTKKRFFSVSMLFGLFSTGLVIIGMALPMLDMSAFHEKIQIEYNIFNVCENVGLISASWKGIPYGIIIGVVSMLVLSFVDIPILKLIPTIIIFAMLMIMLVDMGNIIEWAKELLRRYFLEDLIEVDRQNVVKSFSAGVYCMVAGMVVGLVSCFCPGRK